MLKYSASSEQEDQQQADRWSAVRYFRIFTLLLAAAVVLGLTMAIDAFQPLPAHAQTTNTPTITIATDQASVYEGGLAVFRLTRYGARAAPSPSG